ncbi:MAG: carboxymuconolactone decarboxylase family protein [Candidatus Ranarchaeia archaeon]
MTADPYDIYRRFDSELVDMYIEFQEKVFTDDALPRKTKYLIALALAAFNTSEGGLREYTTLALEAGGTWKEIREALRVAYYIGHASPFWTTIRSFREKMPSPEP